MAKLKELTEIALTQDRGYVVKETQREVDILGGYQSLGCLIGSQDSSDEKKVREKIRRSMTPDVFGSWAKVFDMSGINGYVLHSQVPTLNDETMITFSAVRYKPKSKRR